MRGFDEQTRPWLAVKLSKTGDKPASADANMAWCDPRSGRLQLPFSDRAGVELNCRARGIVYNTANGEKPAETTIALDDAEQEESTATDDRWIVLAPASVFALVIGSLVRWQSPPEVTNWQQFLIVISVSESIAAFVCVGVVVLCMCM